MSNLPRPSSIGLAIYNPDLLSKEDLVVQFVARQGLLDMLVEDIRRATASNGIQHHLIIGQRGMGKTTLLRRIRFAIEDDPALSKQWFPLTFPEEQYNVTRMSDFWANCLDAFSDMLDEAGREEEAEQIDEAVKNLPDENEEQRAQIALETLTKWADREGKGLLLLLDNVDVIFERLSKYQWELREILSHNNKLIFIGAASTPIPATYEYDAAFYDFFQIHELRGLNIEETESVLLKLSELRNTPHVAEIVKNDPARIKALRVLTGGNTRVLVVLYQVLAQEKDGSVISELEQVLDLHTPYYKAIFEALSPQLQQIVGAMCLHWDPITAAELAALPTVRLETNAVSAQLDRLTREGVVEKAPTPTGEKLFYQVSERFFNIWYLMRASRRLRRKLIWLVDFLKIFYAPEDLHNRAHRFLQAEPLARRAEMAFAYAHAVDKPDLRHALEFEAIRSMLKENRSHRKVMGSMFDFEADDSELKSHAERIAELHELRELVFQTNVNWPNCTAEDFWQQLGGSWILNLEDKKQIVDKLETLTSQQISYVLKATEGNRRRLMCILSFEEIQSLMEAIRSGDMVDHTDVEGADAAAIRLNAPILSAIARLESVIKKRPNVSTYEIEELLEITTLNGDSPYPWYELGILLSESPDLRDGAEDHYRKALVFFPNHPSLWYGLGNLFVDLGRYSEAEDAFRKSVEFDPGFVWAWNSLGNLMMEHFDRYEEAESAFRKAIELDPKDAFYWGNLGIVLHQTDRYEEAEGAYRKAIEFDPNETRYWLKLGNIYHFHLNQYSEAEIAYRKSIDLDSNFPKPWIGLGKLLVDQLARYSEAEDAYRKAIELDSENALPWLELANLLGVHLERYDEAESAYRKALEFEPNNAWGWVELANLLAGHYRRYGEAEIAFRKAIENDSNQPLTWYLLGTMLHDLKRFDEAKNAYYKSIQLDPNFAPIWNALGSLLADHFGYKQEAVDAFRKAIEIDPSENAFLNTLAWTLFQLGKDIEEAEDAARKAVKIDPNEVYSLHTLACILVRQNKWEEAVALTRHFIVEGGSEYHTEVWSDIITLFKDAVKTGHAADAVKLLDDIGYEDRWRPLREALRAIAEGNDGPLLRVAPEIRLPAEEIVAQLLPEGEKLESSIKPPRSKKPSRKR